MSTVKQTGKDIHASTRFIAGTRQLANFVDQFCIPLIPFFLGWIRAAHSYTRRNTQAIALSGKDMVILRLQNAFRSKRMEMIQLWRNLG